MAISSVLMEWVERNGPPVRKPTRSGFGRLLLDKLFQGDASGGNVSLQFEPEGVTCSIQLRADSVVAINLQPEPLSHSVSAAVEAVRLAGTSVLVVEDNPLVSVDIAEIIGRAGAAVVGPFHSLDTALEVAAGATFDIALLDVDLHGTDVWPLARLVRGRSIPIVFLTNSSDVETRADEFRRSPTLRKPYDADELLRMLAHALPRAVHR